MTTDNKRECENCQHFRPQVSYVEQYKDTLDSRRELFEALNELRKEEIELLEGEMEMLVELCRVEDAVWPTTPRFAPMCGLLSGPFVTAIKNRKGDCPDHKPTFMRDHQACHSCTYLLSATTFVGAHVRN